MENLLKKKFAFYNYSHFPAKAETLFDQILNEHSLISLKI